MDIDRDTPGIRSDLVTPTGPALMDGRLANITDPGQATAPQVCLPEDTGYITAPLITRSTTGIGRGAPVTDIRLWQVPTLSNPATRHRRRRKVHRHQKLRHHRNG